MSADGGVMVAQSKRTMTFRVKLDTLSVPVIELLFGPQAALALQFRRINPHWYLDGGDE
ncbi:hypothetical protein SEA_FINDLEY_63 [Mycobacterium phage Findley]|uniref:Uncharacterized protein n=1 Tax=Mycobacterium phage Findley TaxID=2015882 RepID=A0A222ZQ05_9CAUD|nr:hypothetical protein I5G77_gp63 [Mycobacterium phage Findley]ASR86803.1 hypothetical protein SEA_FINDLEY_63 [Mycobacterium phage Findley]